MMYAQKLKQNKGKRKIQTEVHSKCNVFIEIAMMHMHNNPTALLAITYVQHPLTCEFYIVFSFIEDFVVDTMLRLGLISVPILLAMHLEHPYNTHTH